MKKDNIYFLLIGVLVLILILVNVSRPEEISWEKTHSKKHKIPFGNFIMFDLLQDIFPGQSIDVSYEPAYIALQNDTDSQGKSYIMMKDYLVLDEFDTKRILQFTESGNYVFIAADYVYGNLRDTLGIEISENWEFFDQQQTGKKATYINFTNPKLKETKAFPLRKDEPNLYFANTGKAAAEILGTDQDNKPNFIAIPHGKGKIFMASNSTVFTNYYMLYNDDARYVSKCFSYLPIGPVIWDEFYKVGRQESQTPFRFLLQTKQFRWAWFSLLAFILLFLLFESKRRQRVIPVVEPFKNTTMEFTETIGRLYYNQGDHNILAKKKVLFFLERLRNTFFVQTTIFNEEFIDTVSAKSGLPKDEIRELFRYINAVQSAPDLSQAMLSELNKKIENFEKKSKT